MNRAFLLLLALVAGSAHGENDVRKANAQASGPPWQSAALIWVDGNGSVVGPWVGGEAAIWRSPFGLVWVQIGGVFPPVAANEVTRKIVGSIDYLYYLSADCTGTIYGKTNVQLFGVPNDLILVGGITAPVLYRARYDLPAITVAGSYRRQNETTCLPLGPNFPVYEWRLDRLMNFNFVPPFSLQ